MALSAEQLLPISEIYSADVQAKYQSSERLQGIMPEVSNIGGVRHDWIGSTLEMSQTPFGAANIASSGVSFTPVQTVPLRFVLKTTIAEADQSLTNVNLQRAHTNMHGKAAARLVDLLKIRAIFNNTGITIADLNVVPKTIGPDTGLNTYKMNAMATTLNNEDVDLGDRRLFTNSDQFDNLFNEDRYINYFTSNKNAINQDMKPYANFDLRMLGKNATNSLPITAGTGTPDPIGSFNSYAVGLHYDAMQFMFNIPMRTVVWWDGGNLNYVIVTEIVANAQIMQKEGIVLAALSLDATGKPYVNS